MSYTATQLRTMYSAVHIGLAPDQATGAALDTVAGESLAGLRTDASAKAFVINGADKDTAVAALSYEFYTGAAPSAAGMAYLVNSSANATDLNDPYYAGFNLENRYINFATNLGVVGEGAAGFAGAYGSLTFSQAVDLAYEKIIGTTYAQAAGLNSAAARADITGREAYFTALANQNFASGSVAQRDLAAKAGVVGYILAEAMKADVGVYAAAMNSYSAALIDGTAVYGQDLLVAYPSTPTPTPVTDPTATPPSGPGAIITNLPAGNNIFVAGAGDNTITAGSGDNTITAGGGNDIITAGAGNDTINAGNGTNFVNGGNGNNTLTTGTGNDTIVGGTGNDTISAGDGTNIVTTGAGNDTVTTGVGNDIIVMGPNLSSLDTVSGGAGTDILKVSGTLAGVAFANVTGIEILDLTGAADV
ncbi:MAG: hypothetical protein PSX79_11260, partial [bacterium]|nr:hypothetical protein [bacterium]